MSTEKEKMIVICRNYKENKSENCRYCLYATPREGKIITHAYCNRTEKYVDVIPFDTSFFVDPNYLFKMKKYTGK